MHRDVWEHDLGSQPTPVDFPQDAGTVPAIIPPSKQGDIYVLDRATGESLQPVEEHPVPGRGEIEPEYISPIQPASSHHQIRFEPLQERDMYGMSPIDKMFRRANYEGFFQPPTAHPVSGL